MDLERLYLIFSLRDSVSPCGYGKRAKVCVHVEGTECSTYVRIILLKVTKHVTLLQVFPTNTQSVKC